ncbi:MAG: hypothetical protein ACRCST_00600 [Turicibacter sp.]
MNTNDKTVLLGLIVLILLLTGYTFKSLSETPKVSDIGMLYRGSL